MLLVALVAVAVNRLPADCGTFEISSVARTAASPPALTTTWLVPMNVAPSRGIDDESGHELLRKYSSRYVPPGVRNLPITVSVPPAVWAAAMSGAA